MWEKVPLHCCLVLLAAVSALASIHLHELDHIQADIRHVGKEVHEEVSKFRHQGVQFNGTGCQCIGYDCGCCVYMDVPKIGLDDTGCVNLTYLPAEYGISLTFTIDKYVLLNETISARNPPPLCFGVPYLEKEASLCLDLYDLDITKKDFKGCVQIEARLLHLVVQKVKVGCFDIPLAGKLNTDDLHVLDEQRRWLDVVNVLRKVKLMKMEDRL